MPLLYYRDGSLRCGQNRLVWDWISRKWIWRLFPKRSDATFSGAPRVAATRRRGIECREQGGFRF
jgi:hypothetical protein